MAKKKENMLSEETMRSLRELGAVLRNIHGRLASEGYTYRDGALVPPDELRTDATEGAASRPPPPR